MADLSPIEVAHFWSRVDAPSSFQCWEWKGRSNPSGYGRYKQTMAHRVAYELVNGDIPNGHLIRHICDNPACCNPRHLLTGTHQDNSDDCVERGRQAHSARNGKSKLSEDQVRAIRRARDMRLKDLAERFGVSEATISYVRSGRSYKHVPMD